MELVNKNLKMAMSTLDRTKMVKDTETVFTSGKEGISTKVNTMLIFVTDKGYLYIQMEQDIRVIDERGFITHD